MVYLLEMVHFPWLCQKPRWQISLLESKIWWFPALWQTLHRLIPSSWAAALLWRALNTAPAPTCREDASAWQVQIRLRSGKYVALVPGFVLDVNSPTEPRSFHNSHGRWCPPVLFLGLVSPMSASYASSFGTFSINPTVFTKLCQFFHKPNLVGGLEHGFYFSIHIYIGKNNPDWLYNLYFSEGQVNHQPVMFVNLAICVFHQPGYSGTITGDDENPYYEGSCAAVQCPTGSAGAISVGWWVDYILIYQCNSNA